MSSSSSSVGHNEDIVAHISLYLPVKSILRFRSVSNQWYSLLTHPHFVKCHASHRSRNSMLYIRELGYGVVTLDVNRHNNNLDIADFSYLRNQYDQGSLLLARSCNGLLLLVSKSNSPEEGQEPQRCRFYICNPYTRKHSELALPDYITSDHSPFLPNLAFDPSKSPFYKVIFLWRSDPACGYHISIYSSETKACRELVGHAFEDYRGLHAGIFSNGAIWWTDFVYGTCSKSWSYFDTNQLSFNNVFPKHPNGLIRLIKYFGGYGGHLHLVMDGRHEPLQDVFELKDDHSEWIAKYKIDFDAIAVDFPQIIYIHKNLPDRFYVYNVVCVLEKEKEEEEGSIVLLVGCPGDELILAYNFIDKTTKKLFDIPSDGSTQNVCWNHAFYCPESLFGV